MKNISILGSTGSIGTQALDVIRHHKEKFNVIALSANNNVDLLLEQIKEFKPALVCVYNEKSYELLGKKLIEGNIKDVELCTKMDGLVKVATCKGTDLLLTCVVGMIGLIPTVKAIENKIDIALANKETLVVAGDIVISKAREYGVKILPVDSEHSAIFQCLVGEKNSEIKNIMLTASGGAFRGMEKSQIMNKKAREALKHPNWSMGSKITIDSATLMNKGLEIIEAYHLFNTPLEKIKVYVHKQSLIHSMVEFVDNSIKAQIAVPDMRGAISYAFFYPNRTPSVMNELDLFGKNMTFDMVDEDTFPCIKLAKESLKQGGTSTCVLNSANEELVYAYLADKIKFYDINEIIEKALEQHKFINNPTLEEILVTDLKTRLFVKEYLKEKFV